MVFVASDSIGHLDRLMAYLNSGLTATLLEAMVAFGSYEVGAVARLPFIDPGAEAGRFTRELTLIRMAEGERSETDHAFVSPWAASTSEADRALKVSRQVDEEVARAIGEEVPTRPLSVTYPTRWFEEDYNPPGAPTTQRELSYLLGAGFGRWDIRLAAGARELPPFPGPYDPLPRVSRGMLVGVDGTPVRQPTADYPLTFLPTACYMTSPAISTMWWQPSKAPSSTSRRPRSHQSYRWVTR